MLGSFATSLTTGLHGIGLAPDDNSLYVTCSDCNFVEHYDLSGVLLDSFLLSGQHTPYFMTVVPNPTPEPGSAALLGLGALLLSARRRRRA